VKLAIPDMISNSYFPAIAAIELGLFKREGLDVPSSSVAIFPTMMHPFRGRSGGLITTPPIARIR
jgi:hypothetical protein